MSKPEVVFRVVDRAGNLHRLKAVELVTEHERVAVFRNAVRDEVASFVEPIAVTLDSAESFGQLPLVQGVACTTVIQSGGGMSKGLIWLSAASWVALVALVALRVYEFFA